jgi:hypothetical protein
MLKPQPAIAGRRDALITTCPACNQLAQLPAAISIESVVQCPTCKSRYPVRAVLPEDVPELTVVSADGEQLFGPMGTGPRPPQAGMGETARAEDPPQPVVIGRLEVNEILRNGARRKRNRSQRRESPSTSQESDLVQPLGPPRRKPHHGRPGRSSAGETWDRIVKNESRVRNPQLEMVKVLVGALAALPVAQLIIWWVMGLDPFHMAPAVRQYLPALVPPSLRQEAESEEAEPGSSVAAADRR